MQDLDAAWQSVKEYATLVETGQMGSYEGARRIGQIGEDFAPLYPLLRIFIAAWKEWDEYPEHSSELESQIRTAAAALIPMHIPSSPGKGSEVDRLVKIASNQRAQGHNFNGYEAAEILAAALPAGHLLSSESTNVWIPIGSHKDTVIVLLHSVLPFAFQKFGYDKYVHSAATKQRILVAEVPDAEMTVLSLTCETLRTLAGRDTGQRDPLPWLSLNLLQRLTGKRAPDAVR